MVKCIQMELMEEEKSGRAEERQFVGSVRAEFGTGFVVRYRRLGMWYSRSSMRVAL